MTAPRAWVPEPRPLTEQTGESFTALVAVMRRLLAPDGCPWDREQTFESLRRYVVEEACEVVDAIDSGDRGALADELGDLLLQVAFQAELGRVEGSFGPDDVARLICHKLVRRHPHVFAAADAATASDVERAWEAIKAEESGPRSVLGSLPRAYPALARAQALSTKAARVGFDWPDASGSRRKVDEELAELDEAATASDRDALHHELGDLLFATVNLARHLGLDAELALRDASSRFERRFGHVERRVRDVHGGFPRDDHGKPTVGLPLEELDGYWEEAKRLERESVGAADAAASDAGERGGVGP